jgi:predicted  nucleic acid-binding Zn-ribbon protein
MRRHLAQGRIRPKISTMPRQQSEAAAILDTYKLVIEKDRLHQELQSIDQRRQQIVDRLTLLDNQVAELEKTAYELRHAAALEPTAGTQRPRQESLSEGFDTLFLDY